MTWVGKMAAAVKKHHKDFKKKVEYEKDVDVDVHVNVKQAHETVVRVDKDIDKNIDVDVDVKLSGNHAELDGHAEAVSKEYFLDSINIFTAKDSDDTSTVFTQTGVYSKDYNAETKEGHLGSTLIGDGMADGKHSYAELAYSFNFDEKGLTEIIIHGEAHGIHHG